MTQILFAHLRGPSKLALIILDIANGSVRTYNKATGIDDDQLRHIRIKNYTNPN